MLSVCMMWWTSLCLPWNSFYPIGKSNLVFKIPLFSLPIPSLLIDQNWHDYIIPFLWLRWLFRQWTHNHAGSVRVLLWEFANSTQCPLPHGEKNTVWTVRESSQHAKEIEMKEKRPRHRFLVTVLTLEVSRAAQIGVHVARKDQNWDWNSG